MVWFDEKRGFCYVECLIVCVEAWGLAKSGSRVGVCACHSDGNAPGGRESGESGG